MANQWLFNAENDVEETVAKEKQEELFVFGYACKLFRDDEKARNVDKGVYLIPWMGDERLKIDRYDGRGHLYDLSAYDADKVKIDTKLSEEEKQIEALCDEERYLELHTDMAEKSMYEEEEWKRYYESLSEGYKAVGFSYDYYSQGQGHEKMEEQVDADEEPFVPPAELKIPHGMELPDTVKENAIIEKTAKFIAEHGAQMEIMMKTKQARNPQFEFMHFENRLHTYYKHLIKMIKSGIYKPKSLIKEEESEDKLDDSLGEDGQHGYLHPQLMNRASPTPEVYKPVPMPKVSIHETPYGQLLQSLTKSNQEAAEKNRPKKEKQEIKKEPETHQDSSSLSACITQTVYGPTRPGIPPPPGIEPVTLPSHPKDTASHPGGIKTGEDRSVASLSEQLAHIVPPPPDVQPVVDRMAMYVAKNGVEFEIVVKSKKDPRFEFLHSWHKHFAYYDFKKRLFIQEMEREKEEKEEKAALAASKGVSFKVKAKDQEQITLEKKKVFEYESSDEEHTGEAETIKEKGSKSDVSGTSTPLNDLDPTSEPRSELPPDLLEKKQAEQRVRDRLVASAREKLSQADKEKHLQAERKRKAAMFINMLKGTGQSVIQDSESVPSDTASDTCIPDSKLGGGSSSKRNSEDRERSSRHSKSKSKHKSRHHRSRSRSGSRSKSRSRSRSRSRSKKKRKRSATPPSAYAVFRRSPTLRPPPPPPLPSRYHSPTRWRDHSPEDRHKSGSHSRSKSKRKRRSHSCSPHKSKSKTESDSHHRSSKKKKKKSRSRSRSPHRKHKKSKRKSHSPVAEDVSIEPTPACLHPTATDLELLDTQSQIVSSSPAEGLGTSDLMKEENSSDNKLEDGEILSQETVSRSSSPKLPDDPEPYSASCQVFPSNSSSFSDVSDSRHSSPHSHRESPTAASRTSLQTQVQSAEDENADWQHTTTGNTGGVEPTKNVSQYMLSRVRAIIKASREAIMKDDDP